MIRSFVGLVVVVCVTISQLTTIAATATPKKTLEPCTKEALKGSTVSLPANADAKRSEDGSVFPVLFVHGFNDNSDTWTRPALASWSHPPKVSNPKSFTNVVGDIPGAAAVLFDYRENGLNWVDNPAIGDALGKTIDCLFKQSGQQVAIVAHSMGGLAARQALSKAAQAEHVSLVVTIGTPNLGSFLPQVAAGASVGAEVINRWTQNCIKTRGRVAPGQHLLDRLPCLASLL